MAVPEKAESRSPCWLSSTNWLVADGSLEGSISFETSSAEGGEVIPIGVLLERPADSPPCEITIFFKERHELHSIYVRSSARVYEVYYASDREVSSNEYLCTVRCGAALQEVTQDMCEGVLADGTVPNGINSDFPRSNSNNVTEDGWVEVEVPDSFMPDITSMSNISVENISPKTLIDYEATAEISDASPCMSITLRLLSLQIKTSVHIDEIYIYADPVEDGDLDPPVSNVGTGSLLSMLMPSLLQLSKSGTSRLQDKGFSDVSARPNYVFSTEGTTHTACPDKFETSEVEASSTMENSKVGLDQQHKHEKLGHPLMATSNIASDLDEASKTKPDENNRVRGCVANPLDESVVRHTQTKPGDAKLRLTEEEKGSDQSQMTMYNETNAPYVRLEKTLDDLVSRMGKLENFCLSFQESILKPITGIEMRLQRMEEQLAAFSKVPRSSELYPTTMTSRFSAHESSFENEGSKSSSAGVDSSFYEKETLVDLMMASSPESEKVSGLVVKAPESEKVSGLVVKAPEFTDDDDDDSSNISSSVDLTPNEYPKKGKCFSIDNALASALAAFVTSTTYKSSLNKSHSMVMSNEQQNLEDHCVDSAAVPVQSEADINRVPEWFLGNKNCDARDEMCQSEKSCSDVVDPDRTLNKFDMIDRTGAKVQGNYLCDESLLADDDLSAEIKTNESKGLIIRAPEFPNDDDILDCVENSESHVSSYSNTHSLAQPHSLLTPLALFLSSRKVSPCRSSSNSHDDPLELSTSERNSFSSTTCQVQAGSDDMRPSSLENYVNTAVESSLVGCFLSQGGSQLQLGIFHGTAVIGEENSSFIQHSMEDANHVLKCDGFHSNGMSKGCTITQNLLPCNVHHIDTSSICIQDKECWVGGSEVRAAEVLMSDLLGKLLAADDSTSSVFDDISMSSKPHPEYSDSNGMDSFIGAFAVTGQNSGQATSNSGSSETLVRCQSGDSISQMKSLFESKQMSSFIPVQDDLTSNVKFCTDKDLRSWLPLEILLGEKQDDVPKKDDPLKLVREHLVSNPEFSVDRNLTSELPLEVPLDNNPDEVENGNNGNGEYNKQHNSPSPQGSKHNCEIADNTLLDIEDNVVQSEISSMVTAGDSHYSVCFSSGNPFSSLI